MQKFGEFICKHKKIILIIALILLIPSVIGMKATKINYDILMYLPDDIETVQGESILAQDFNMGAFSMITVDNMKTKDILKLEDKLKKIGNVESGSGKDSLFHQKQCNEQAPDTAISIKKRMDGFKLIMYQCCTD